MMIIESNMDNLPEHLDNMREVLKELEHVIYTQNLDKEEYHTISTYLIMTCHQLIDYIAVDQEK